jgi:two-component system response regulator WspF
MRIGIVNDQPDVIETMRRALSSRPARAVAWVAANGAEAIRKCATDTPDLVLMDLSMPVMDGVQATRHIMRECPCAILIVTASVSERVSQVFEAMSAGALDAVNAPVIGQDNSLILAFLNKIDLIERLIAPRTGATADGAHQPVGKHCTVPLIAIGASTGGPAVLKTLLASLPGDFPACVVIVQHVDVQFAGELSNWLGRACKLPVRIIGPGDRPSPGVVLIAATNDHLILTSRRRLDYRPEPSDYAYRPSVNVFFDSLGSHWPEPGLAILLTGMGRDGAAGLLTLRDLGWRTVAQNEETCAVFGMPKAARDMEAADQVLTPEQIAEEMLRMGQSGIPAA